MNRLQSTVKHGGFSVLVWGAIWYDGKSELVVCEGRTNSAKYIEILKEGLLPIFDSAHVDKNHHLFMKDGAPYHLAKKTQTWHQQNVIQKLWWPSQSPDINPIEHIWHILDLAIRKRTLKVANKEVLLQYIQEWEKIPMTKVAELVNSMPMRVNHLAHLFS